VAEALEGSRPGYRRLVPGLRPRKRSLPSSRGPVALALQREAVRKHVRLASWPIAAAAAVAVAAAAAAAVVAVAAAAADIGRMERTVGPALSRL
jgi:hypothetical protein